MAPITPAPISIIVAHQKDKIFIENITDEINYFFQKILGIRKWVLYKDAIEFSSKFSYYGLTTLLGLQTLGEEYTDIVMIKGQSLSVPSFLKRLLLVLSFSTENLIRKKIHTWVNIILDLADKQYFPKFLNKFVSNLETHDSVQILEKLLNYINKANFSYFLIKASYFTILHRILSINYTSLKQYDISDSSKLKIKLCGYLSLLTFCLQIYGENKKKKQENNEAKLSLPLNKKIINCDLIKICDLCLRQRQEPTATKCGHVFCWKCIHEWAQVKDTCPICREDINQSNLIHLQNYC